MFYKLSACFIFLATFLYPSSKGEKYIHFIRTLATPKRQVQVNTSQSMYICIFEQHRILNRFKSVRLFFGMSVVYILLDAKTKLSVGFENGRIRSND